MMKNLKLLTRCTLLIDFTAINSWDRIGLICNGKNVD